MLKFKSFFISPYSATDCECCEYENLIKQISEIAVFLQIENVLKIKTVGMSKEIMPLPRRLKRKKRKVFKATLKELEFCECTQACIRKGRRRRKINVMHSAAGLGLYKDLTEFVQLQSKEGLGVTEFVSLQSEEGLGVTEFISSQREEGLGVTEFVSSQMEEGPGVTEFVSSQSEEGLGVTEFVSSQSEEGLGVTKFVSSQSEEGNSEKKITLSDNSKEKIDAKQKEIMKDIRYEKKRENSFEEKDAIKKPFLTRWKNKKNTDDVNSEIENLLQTIKRNSVADDKMLYKYMAANETLDLSYKDLETLKPDMWLNDNVINFYLGFKYDKLLDKEKVMLKNTYFYSRLQKYRKCKQEIEQLQSNLDEHIENFKTISSKLQYFAEVKELEKKMKIYDSKLTMFKRSTDRIAEKEYIFSKDFIVVPVNNNKHWVVCIICFPSHIDHFLDDYSVTSGNNISNDEAAEVNETFEVMRPSLLLFDSYLPTDYINKEELFSILRDYILREWNYNHYSDPLCFNEKNMPGYLISAPQQYNQSDCGVLMMHNVECFFEDRSPFLSPRFPPDLRWWFHSECSSKLRCHILKFFDEPELRKIKEKTLEYVRNEEIKEQQRIQQELEMRAMQGINSDSRTNDDVLSDDDIIILD